MARDTITGGGATGSAEGATAISEGPNTPLGFEIQISDYQSFIPAFYPDDFTQVKKKKLKRYSSGSCSGESVSIKSIKNRELHAKGVMTENQISTFHELMDYHGKVDLISPLAPKGGLECFIKSAELGNQAGWDPMTQQRQFEYTLDLISTGRDEGNSGPNAIVSAIIDSNTEGTSGVLSGRRSEEDDTDRDAGSGTAIEDS